MKKILLIATIVFGLCTQVAQAQTPKLKVGTNPTTLNSSAALEVQSTTQGFLPPRMNLSQITAIANPAEGLSVYCIDCAPKTLLSFDGINWLNANGQQPIVLSAPSVPGTPVATAGNAQASVSFTAPVNNGGSVITGYTITSNLGGITATGTSSPITVNGLTNGTAYTFTVTATNANGTSAASAPSSSVTPTEGLPSQPIFGTPATIGMYVNIPVTSNGNGETISSYTATINPGNIVSTSAVSPVVFSLPTNGTYSVTVTATNSVGTSIASDPINVTVVASTSAILANTITALNSSGQPFNNHPSITSTSLVSVGGDCPSSVTWQGVTYPTINLNGMCWMKQDFRGVPSNFQNLTTTSWLNTSPDDIGSWGFYNTADTTGASGWAYSNLTANSTQGYLYQWSAAMNGDTIDRAQGVCPTGWHLPSSVELAFFVFNYGSPNTLFDPSNTTTGVCFTPAIVGNNAAFHNNFATSIFLWRNPNGTFGNFGMSLIGADYWSSTSITSSKAYQLHTGDPGFCSLAIDKAKANKVRCIKD